MLIMSNFSFSHIVLKRLVLYPRKSKGLFEKGLSHYCDKVLNGPRKTFWERDFPKHSGENNLNADHHCFLTFNPFPNDKF